MVKYASLGLAIKEAREKCKLTQDGLAAAVGARGGRFTVIRWEQGLHKPTEYAAQLVEVLGLDARLLEDEEEEEAASMSLARDLHLAIERVVEARVQALGVGQ